MPQMPKTFRPTLTPGKEFEELIRELDFMFRQVRADIENAGPITSEGGVAVKMVNGTGADTVKGQLVTCSTTADNVFVTEANSFDTIGVVYDADVPDGGAARIVVSGIADVLWKENTASRRGYVAIAEADGTASDLAVPSSNPVQGEHFKEIGHVRETKSAPGVGENLLVKCVLHFN